jgi:hypothetical protein
MEWIHDDFTSQIERVILPADFDIKIVAEENEAVQQKDDDDEEDNDDEFYKLLHLAGRWNVVGHAFNVAKRPWNHVWWLQFSDLPLGYIMVGSNNLDLTVHSIPATIEAAKFYVEYVSNKAVIDLAIHCVLKYYLDSHQVSAIFLSPVHQHISKQKEKGWCCYSCLSPQDWHKLGFISSLVDKQQVYLFRSHIQLLNVQRQARQLPYQEGSMEKNLQKYIQIDVKRNKHIVKTTRFYNGSSDSDEDEERDQSL